MSEAKDYQELWELLSALADDDLSEPGRARLATLLREDPAAQDLYLAYLGLHAELHLDYAAGAGQGGLELPRPSSAHQLRFLFFAALGFAAVALGLGGLAGLCNRAAAVGQAHGSVA